MNEFKRVVEEKREQVWEEVQSYLKDPVYPRQYIPEPAHAHEVETHWRLVREYPERQGKYLRPLLVLLTAGAMGIDDTLALKTAAAMQVSEEWILIHDDLEDESLFRRGKPTLHRMYNPALAINAGDTLHLVMWKMLKDNRDLLGTDITFSLLDEFYRMLMRTALGQSTEILWTKENKMNFSDTDWFFIADGKTSYYTITAPMRLGAIIAGAHNEQLDALAEFGQHLGRSFQIIDDILDLTTDFNGLKTQQGNDVYEGKRTVIMGHLMRTAPDSDKTRLALIIRKNRDEKTAEEVEWVIEKMSENGSIEYARELAMKEASEAQRIFEDKLVFLSHHPEREHIKQFIEFVIQRKH